MFTDIWCWHIKSRDAAQFLPCFEYYSSENNKESEGKRYNNSLGAVVEERIKKNTVSRSQISINSIGQALLFHIMPLHCRGTTGEPCLIISLAAKGNKLIWISLGVCSGPTGKEHHMAAVFQSFPQLCSATAADQDDVGIRSKWSHKHTVNETTSQGLAAHMAQVTYLPQEQQNIWYLALKNTFENTSSRPGHSTILVSHSPKEVHFWTD